jgi:hypothetical protein
MTDTSFDNISRSKYVQCTITPNCILTTLLQKLPSLSLQRPSFGVGHPQTAFIVLASPIWTPNLISTSPKTSTTFVTLNPNFSNKAMLLVLVVLTRATREERETLRSELGVVLVVAVRFVFGCGAWGGGSDEDDEAEKVEDVGSEDDKEEDEGVNVELGYPVTYSNIS